MGAKVIRNVAIERLKAAAEQMPNKHEPVRPVVLNARMQRLQIRSRTVARKVAFHPKRLFADLACSPDHKRAGGAWLMLTIATWGSSCIACMTPAGSQVYSQDQLSGGKP